MMFDNESLEIYLEIAGTVTQAELTACREQGRLGDYAVAYRIFRNKQGGGFGDPDKHPYAWAAIVYVDGLPLRINSARGDCREWSTLDRIGQWMVALLSSSMKACQASIGKPEVAEPRSPCLR